MESKNLIEGITLKLGGVDYVVPPLNFRALRTLGPRIESMTTALSGDRNPNFEEMGIIAEIAHAALKRNYPDMTLEQVEDMIDLSNLKEVVAAVFSVSGFQRKDPQTPAE